MVTINSNLAASAAQRNLGSANSVVQDSISRLSSGNRIIKASDDVAGLSIGTSIKSTVTSLEIALLNTEQAKSVLQIADGALQQVGDILSRQKALATQANSGSLSNTERGYLNQEFTALTAEVDRIVGSTSFNGITLLNGSLAGSATVATAVPAATTTNTVAVAADVVVSASPTYSAVGDITTSGGITTAPDTLVLSSFSEPDLASGAGFGTFTATNFVEASNEFVQLNATINGNVYTANVTADAASGDLNNNKVITFTRSGGGSSFSFQLGAAYTGAINNSGAANTFATELTAAFADVSITQTRSVSGLTTPTTAATSKNITAASVAITSGNFDSENNDFGTIGEFTSVAGSDTANSISVTVNGTTFSTSDIGVGDDSLANGDTITLSGRNAGGDATGESIVITLTTLSSSVNLTSATEVADFTKALNQLFGVQAAGTVTTSSYETVGAITGSNVTSVSVSGFADATYQSEGFGTFSVAQFTEVTGDAEVATLTTTLGDKTYTANLAASANGGAFSAQTLTFTATDGSGSAFSVGIAASGTIGAINNAAGADTVASNITAGLASVDIYQNRTIGSVVSSATANTVLEGVGSVTVKSNNFNTTTNTFGDVGAFTGVAGSGAANTLSVQINGTTFNATDLGTTDDVLSSLDSNITLTGRDVVGNATGETITISLSTLSRSIDLTNQDEVDSLVSALNEYLGVGASGTGGLSFQVGSSVSDSISVTISDTGTEALYVDDEGLATDLSIATQAGSQEAIEVLDNAIASVISRRADVGAAISRFNFAANNIEVSVANQDAARGGFLDADIASESTKFATYQVKLQASVAVLAQANKLPSNLLSLLQ